MWRRVSMFLAIAAAIFVAPTRCLIAGLSPENVIVVVNGQSHVSRTVANEYVELRKIPSSNVIILDDIPKRLVIDLDTFKDRILNPVLKQIEARGLAAQASVIAYSAKFPTSVDVRPHWEQLTDPTLKKYQRPRASINSLTYFYRFVLSDDPRYLSFAANLYCRGPFNRHFVNPFGDPGKQAEFNAANKLFDRKLYAQAGDTFEKLFEAAPWVPALAIRAAEARAKAGEPTLAKTLIVSAVKAGWTSRKWFEENDALAPFLKQPPLSSLSARLSDRPIDVQEPVGFTGHFAWTSAGVRSGDPKFGIPFMLSCMLGVVHEHGSSVDQAIEALNQASQGDFLHPDAEFWFSINKNVRTQTRMVQMEIAKEWIRHLGMKAETVFETAKGKSGNCAGLMLGTGKFSLKNRKFEFVPGAIADNLTSHGGNYTTDSQTKLTDFLHAGAAMSSGTVVEPYSLQPKFPLPMMYGYYASGVTAMEAFYLSVASPFQLLIVGDPLAQAFSRPPTDAIKMTVAKTTSEDDFVVQVKRTAPTGPQSSNQTPAQAVEIYLNGKLVRRVPPVKQMNMKVPKDLRGAIELRTVLVGRDSVLPKRSHLHWVSKPGEPIPTATPVPNTSNVKVQCEGASAIVLMHHSSKIASIQGSQGEIQVDQAKFGGGPVRIQPIARVDNQKVYGVPTVINLPITEPAKPEPAVAGP